VGAPLENQPLVSVIMPFYRQDEYLLEAVESVKAQTYPSWELIVVDDGSDGRSAQEILAGVCASASNIVLLEHEENRGVSAAKNTAFAGSKGELVVPVDSDDVLDPAYLEKMVEALLCSDADGIYADFEFFGEKNCISCSETRPVRILSGWFPPNPVLMKRSVFEAVGGYDTNFDLGEDACFWITAHKLGMKFGHLHEPLYRYRNHAKSGTMTRGRDYPLILTKLARKFPELYSENAVEIVDLLAEHWINDIDVHRNLLQEFQTLESEYRHLHSEFHKLLKHAENAECNRSVSIRATAKSLLREIGSRLKLRPAQQNR
jgi:glycosyltransferase involved in cell wall biosynthesis